MSTATFRTRWWHTDQDTGKVVCTLCPRECHIKAGSRGFCFVRANVDGQLVLTTYGRSSGFCIDPIEKKPLSHFLPGTPVLSLGTAGCNLGLQILPELGHLQEPGDGHVGCSRRPRGDCGSG